MAGKREKPVNRWLDYSKILSTSSSLFTADYAEKNRKTISALNAATALNLWNRPYVRYAGFPLRIIKQDYASTVIMKNRRSECADPSIFMTEISENP